MKIEDRRVRLLYLLRSDFSSFTRNLAEALDVSQRTIFRDIDALTKQGIPIGFDPKKGYFIEHQISVPAIKLSQKELQLLSLGLSFIASQPDEMLRKEAQYLISKMLHTMPSDASSILYGLLEKTRINPDLAQNELSSISWSVLLDGLLKKHPFHFDYRKLNSSKTEKRRLIPEYLSFYSDHWTLEGFDLDRDAVRSFRISNISNLEKVTNQGVVEKPKHRKFAARKKTYSVIVAIKNPIILNVFRQKLPTRILMESKQNGLDVLQFEFGELNFLNRFLLQFGSDISILAPLELKSYRIMELEKMLSDSKKPQ